MVDSPKENERGNQGNEKVRSVDGFKPTNDDLMNFYCHQAPSGTAGTSEDESSYSSFYSSFLKTDESQTSSNDGRGENFKYAKDSGVQWEQMPKIPIKRPNPHWLENVELTNDLVYQYQVDARTLSDVLNADLYALTSVNQVRKLFPP